MQQPRQIVLVTNESSSITPDQLDAWIVALQVQLDRDFSPAWSAEATVLRAVQPAGGYDHYSILLTDAVTDPSDLGWHLVSGTPSAIIQVQETLSSGATLSSVLSHELLEMLADPTCVRFAADGRHIVEVCDPVEENGYLIEGVQVSNFVLPSYFSGGAGPWDFNGQLAGACPALLPGGYIMEWTGESWTSHFGRKKDGSLSWHALRNGRSRRRASTPPRPA